MSDTEGNSSGYQQVEQHDSKRQAEGATNEKSKEGHQKKNEERVTQTLPVNSKCNPIELLMSKLF